MPLRLSEPCSNGANLETCCPRSSCTTDGRTFVTELRAFLEYYGQRSASLLVSDRSWIEDPTPVVKNLQHYVSQPDPDLARGAGIARGHEGTQCRRGTTTG